MDVTADKSESWADKNARWGERLNEFTSGAGKLIMALSILAVTFVVLPYVIIDWAFSDVVLDADLATIRTDRLFVRDLELCKNNPKLAPKGVDPWDCTDSLIMATKKLHAQSVERLPVVYQWKLKLHEMAKGPWYPGERN
jgi:hypothetical protein